MSHVRIRSFVRRGGDGTAGQKKAYDALWPVFGLEADDRLLNAEAIFERQAPCYLEIGFGSGQSLLACAQAYPHYNFIGIEAHRPGIGALMMGIRTHGLTNIRVLNGDAVDIIEQNIPHTSLDGVQIFFPDPWQKRRHHPRRLIQPDFVKKITDKLKPGGTLHLATDWDDYAIHMMHVLTQSELINLAGVKQFAERSSYRPLETKFECRAIAEGRNIWELQFAKR